jgi:hypothetical protein
VTLEDEKSTIPVDSELTCPVLAAHHISASSGSVLPVGMWAGRSAVHMSTGPPPLSGFKRRVERHRSS